MYCRLKSTKVQVVRPLCTNVLVRIFLGSATTSAAELAGFPSRSEPPAHVWEALSRECWSLAGVLGRFELNGNIAYISLRYAVLFSVFEQLPYITEVNNLYIHTV